MKIIVDTAIWSLALRRQKKSTTAKSPDVLLFHELISDGRVIMLGTIRQEILSGIRYKEQYQTLKDYLRAFPDLKLLSTDYEIAASYFNICRKSGVQGSNTDFLICAAASQRAYGILTTDKDFDNFSSYIPVNLIAR